jgi:hypothetical protein
MCFIGLNVQSQMDISIDVYVFGRVVVVVCGCMWSYVVVCGRMWSYMVACGRMWSYVVVVCTISKHAQFVFSLSRSLFLFHSLYIYLYHGKPDLRL